MKSFVSDMRFIPRRLHGLKDSKFLCKSLSRDLWHGRMDWNYWVWKSKGQFSHASWSIDQQDWVKQQKLENRCLWEGCHWRWATILRKLNLSISLTLLLFLEWLKLWWTHVLCKWRRGGHITKQHIFYSPIEFHYYFYVLKSIFKKIWNFLNCFFSLN